MCFILAGIIEVLIPVEFVQTGCLLKPDQGNFGTLGGILLAMGPYAAFPIIASILVSGAGLGTVVALITGWCIRGYKAPLRQLYGVKFSYINYTEYPLSRSRVWAHCRKGFESAVTVAFTKNNAAF